MRIIEYHHRNFSAVIKLLRNAQNALKNGQNGRVLFNADQSWFEYYDPDEIHTINPHAKYGHVEEAMQAYLDKMKKEETAVNTQDNSKADSVKESALPTSEIALNDFHDHEILFDDGGPYNETLEPELEDDDKELRDNANNILGVLTSIKRKVDTENQEKLLQVISEIFKLDIVSESDVLKTIVENSELKKLLSSAFHLFGVEVSTTTSTFDLQVSSSLLKFNPKIEYTLDDYRRGIKQASATINALRASEAQIEERDNRIKELERQLAIEKRNSTEMSTQVVALREQKDPIRELHPLIPIYHVICWKNPMGVVQFLTTQKDATQTKDGSYPTKFLEKTKFLTKATKFTSAEAKAQIDKMIKFKTNITFTDLSQVEGRAMQKFFTLARVVVETAGEVVKSE